MPASNDTRPSRIRRMKVSAWPSVFAPRVILVQVGVLLLLASATVWLLLRGERQHDDVRLASEGRAMSELVALSVGPEVNYEDSARFLRVLEWTTREEELVAGAVLDQNGTIVAHTDLTRIGDRLGNQAAWGAAKAVDAEELMGPLFGQASGRIFLHPLIGVDGPIGTVALLFPNASGGFFGRDALKLLLLSALLLLAFVALTKTTVRTALKPTCEFLQQLTNALEVKEEAATDPTAPGALGLVVDQTVSHISKLNDAKETLTIENRVLGYERRRQEQILDHLPDGIVMTDGVEKVIYVNRAGAKMIGLSPDEIEDIEHRSIPTDFAALLSEARHNGEAKFALPEGNGDRHVLVVRTPMGAHQGRQVGTLYILRDVTAQESAQKVQGEFLSQIAHELKTPLNTILTYVEAMADEDLLSMDERREYANNLRSESQRMAQLISNLLQLSRIELGNLSARFGFVKSSALIRGLAESFRPQAANRKITYEVNVAENLAPIYGDKDLLGVAVTNLITNALKYTPEGGTITVRAAAADETDVYIEVQDTGIGIPKEEQERIFERFVRSEQDEVRAQQGTGLGLSLVQEIAEIHEGSITVESQPAKGSTFRLQLPVRAVGTRLDVGAA